MKLVVVILSLVIFNAVAQDKTQDLSKRIDILAEEIENLKSSQSSTNSRISLGGYGEFTYTKTEKGEDDTVGGEPTFDNKRFTLNKFKNEFILSTYDQNSGSNAAITKFPSDLILLNQFINQEFNLNRSWELFDINLLDDSMTDYGIDSLKEQSKAKIWGVTRQNLSKTYNSPIDNKKRIRQRQKLIINLGTTCLKYKINESELIQIIKNK